MFAKLEGIEKEFESILKKLSDPDVIRDNSAFRTLSKKQSDLEPIVSGYRKYKDIKNQLEEITEMLVGESDKEMKELAEEELSSLKKDLHKVEKNLKVALIPKDPNDAKNVMLEIRAGTGGEEAALFGAEIFRMYSRYAEKKHWKIEVLTSSQTGVGGIKEITAVIEGKFAYSKLKFESGTHRVQRVPQTESGGRVHTSAITVAILPEADNVEINIEDKDLRIDTYRSSGAGGQHVNTTDSAIRITHLPTGLVVTCQDEKSQTKNKEQAMRVLRTRLYELEAAKQHEEIASDRKSQVGSGDRSEKIRTYNFPQSRITDHRISKTTYRFNEFLDGELDEFIDDLTTHFQALALKAPSS